MARLTNKEKEVAVNMVLVGVGETETVLFVSGTKYTIPHQSVEYPYTQDIESFVSKGMRGSLRKVKGFMAEGEMFIDAIITSIVKELNAELTLVRQFRGKIAC